MQDVSKLLKLKSISFIRENLKTQARKTVFTVSWNFRYTLILFLLVFGYYGWGTTSGLLNFFSFSNFSTTVAVILISIFFYAKRSDFNSRLQASIHVDFGFLMTAFAFLILGLFINYDFLRASLTVDEVAYAWGAQLQSYVTVFKIAPFLPPGVLSLNSALLLQAVSILIFFVGFLLIRILLSIHRDLSFLLIILTLIFFMRLGFQYLGGNSSPNSPLANIWYFIVSTFGGLHNLSYRIGSLAVFCFLATYLFRQIAQEGWISKLIALLTSLLLFSIPLVSSMSSMLEIATWTFIVSVIVFVELIKHEFKVSERILILLAITYYLRVNIITILATVFVYMALTDGKKILQDKWRFVYPMCIVIPGLAPVIVGRLIGRLSNDGNLAVDFKENAQNSLRTIVLSASSWYVLVVIISIIFLLSKGASRKYILLLVFFDVAVFFGMNSTTLTSNSKYTIEYLFPLVMIIGFWPILINLRSKSLIYGLTVTLLVINVYGLNVKSEVPKSFIRAYDPVNGAISSGYSVVPFSPFAYREAFRFIKSQNLEPCFNAGAVYSSFPEILEGLSLRQVVYNRQSRDEFLTVQSRIGESWTTISYQSILASKINCVILGAVENQGAVVQELEANGWGIVSKFEDTTYGTMVYLMTENRN
jgi:hypothetical protein